MEFVVRRLKQTFTQGITISLLGISVVMSSKHDYHFVL